MSLSNRYAARGRKLLPAPRSRHDRPALARVTTSPVKAPARQWATGPVLDQGQVNACAAFAWASLMLAEPVGVIATAEQGNALGMAIHTTPPSEPVEAIGIGGLWAAEHGVIDGIVWLSGPAELADHLATRGPVAIAVPWYASMSNPNARGLLTVNPGTALAGWHCVAVVGYDPAHVIKPAKYKGWRRPRLFAKRHPHKPRQVKRPARTAPCYRLRNQWTRRWGLDGDAWITATDLHALVESGVDVGLGWSATVCAPVGIHGGDAASLLATT